MHRSGHLVQAETICRQILTGRPGQPDALHLSGVIAHQDGRPEEAVAFLRQALEAKPSDLNIHKNLILILRATDQMAIAAFHCRKALLADSDNYQIYHGLGDLFCSDGYFEAAVGCYEKVLAIKPDSGAVWSNLGNAQQGRNLHDEAIACYRNALQLEPANAEPYYNMGIAYSKKEMFDDAIINFQKALVLAPDHAQALFNMGNAFKSQGCFVKAAACYQKCIHCNGSDVDAHYNLANALYAQGQLRPAMEAYTETLRRKPDHIFALNNLGCLFKDLGADTQAVSILRRSIEIDPNYAAAYVNLGNVYKERNEFENAFQACQKALSLEPENEDALVSMGSLLKKEGRFDEGLEYLKQAVALSPEISNAWWYYYLALPILYETESDIAFYRKRFADGMATLISAVKLSTPEQRKRALAGIGSITNFYLQYQGQDDLELQKCYGRFVNGVMAANFPEWGVSRPMPPLKNNDKIRIGYLSSFMRAHTVGHFLMGWLENHDRMKFEVHCYHIGHATDTLTEAFEQKSDRFYHIPGNIEAVAKRILDDELHILVFTDIGMFAPATQLAGLRLAPIQCKGWGHPVSTGSPTIDYYLSSDLMETEGAAAHYSETLVRLPNLALAFNAPQIPKNGKTRQDFGISDNDFVFLTSQSLFKYLPQYDKIYPRIAAVVKNAKFVFISNPSAGITKRFRKRIEGAFNRHNLSMDRFCIFQPRLSPNDFMSLNQASNVLLDPFSWSGGKTTLEGIRCGLPVVTCPGRFMRGRHAVAMLKMMGITETIAEDAKAYIAIACRLGSDRDFYDRIRNAIAANRHRLYNDETCIRGLEAFYRRVVQAHLPGQEKATLG
ncbi:MAG: tetratricopeptide repeat protein [Desulfobacteraceae bacterium]|nr:tetratricopeptide repeat protein [Desulfobacteraceae bacterium]MBC2750815.1 tetratricopeptide repeat protein [Desulfobacteraceae bacterium]